MALNLNGLSVTTPAITRYEPTTIIAEVPAGKTLKVETFPEGAELASGMVPVGKKWNVKAVVFIEEVDV